MRKITSSFVKLNIAKYHGSEVILQNVSAHFNLFNVESKRITLISKNYIALPNYLYFNDDFSLIRNFILDEKNWLQYKNDAVFSAVGAPSATQYISFYKKNNQIPECVKNENFSGFWTSTFLKNSNSLIFISNDGFLNATKMSTCIAFRPFLTLKNKAYLQKIDNKKFIVRI